VSWSSALHLPLTLRAIQGATPCVRIHTNTVWLAANRAPPLPLGWRIELFVTMTPDASLRLTDNKSALLRATCDDVHVQWLSLPFEKRNATHHLSFACRLLDGSSRQRLLAQPLPLDLRKGPRQQDSDSAATLGHTLFASWFGCEAGTTRHSPAAGVPRFRAPEPPFFSQRLAWQ
jgi:hypothetical protein